MLLFIFILKSTYSSQLQTLRILRIFQLLLHLALSAFDTIGIFFDNAQVSMLEYSPSAKAIGSCVMHFIIQSVLLKKEDNKQKQKKTIRLEKGRSHRLGLWRKT